MSPFRFNRRELLSYLWLGALAAVAAQVGWALQRVARPHTTRGQFGGIFELGRLENLAAVDSPPLPVPEGRFWLVQTPDGLLALDKACTHLDCLVDWDEQSNTFVCPCHGSQFAGDGARLSGPAPRSLDRFSIQVTNAEGEIVVTTDPATGAPLPLDSLIDQPAAASEPGPVASDAGQYLLQVDTGQRMLGAEAGTAQTAKNAAGAK